MSSNVSSFGFFLLMFTATQNSTDSANPCTYRYKCQSSNEIAYLLWNVYFQRTSRIPITITNTINMKKTINIKKTATDWFCLNEWVCQCLRRCQPFFGRNNQQLFNLWKNYSLCTSCLCKAAVHSILTKLFADSDISSHSGLTNSYWPFIIRRSITNCFRCQNGGKPAKLVSKKFLRHTYIINLQCIHNNSTRPP